MQINTLKMIICSDTAAADTKIMSASSFAFHSFLLSPSSFDEALSCEMIHCWICFHHRIIELLEGTFKGHLVQLPCNEQGHLQLDQVAQSFFQPDLEGLQDDRVSTTSLGNPFQCFTNIIVRNFFLMSNLNLFQFETISFCSVTTDPTKESVLSYSTHLDTKKLLSGLPLAFSSPGCTRPAPSTCLHWRSAPFLGSFFVVLLWMCSNRSMSLLH